MIVEKYKTITILNSKCPRFLFPLQSNNNHQNNLLLDSQWQPIDQLDVCELMA